MLSFVEELSMLLMTMESAFHVICTQTQNAAEFFGLKSPTPPAHRDLHEQMHESIFAMQR